MGESKLNRSRADYSVGIGFPCGLMVPWQTTMSLARTIHALALLQIPANIHAIAGSSDVTLARDAVFTNFLATEDKYLFWIDSDIVWAPEQFIRVLRLAKNLGVVCATYPLKQEPSDCIVNFVEASDCTQNEYSCTQNEYGCTQIYSTGLGFTCVRRDIVDAFAATKGSMYHSGNNRMILDAFRRDKRLLADGRQSGVGEDTAFFNDLCALGHKVWLDPSISLGHVGTKEYRVPVVNVAPSEISNV